MRVVRCVPVFRAGFLLICQAWVTFLCSRGQLVSNPAPCATWIKGASTGKHLRWT